MNTILIDLDKLKILKSSSGKDAAKCLEYWAEILIPKADYYIGGDYKKSFSVFTLMELKMLYRNTEGSELNTEKYPKALELVHSMAQSFQTDETTLDELIKKLGKPIPQQTVMPQPEKRKVKPSSSSSGPATRPKEGSTTGKVWAIADQMVESDPGLGCDSKEFRTCVIQECIKSGINPATSATQFARWKKDQLTG